MLLRVEREPTSVDTTFGRLLVDGKPFCLTLEDPVREIPGEPVSAWKIHGETAIPAGMYPVTFEISAHFGRDTLTLNGVPGFEFVRIHGGNDAGDTEGCIIVGDEIDREARTIAGGRRHGVLDQLKAIVRGAHDRVFLLIVNAEG